MKASLKLTSYDPKRDFVGWGGEDIRRIPGGLFTDGRLPALGEGEALDVERLHHQIVVPDEQHVIR